MKFSRTFLASTIVHTVLVVLVVVIPAILHLFAKPPKKEIITFVDMRMAAPALASLAPVPEAAPPAPRPPPPEAAKDIPEPAKKKPEIKKSEKKIKRSEAKPKPQTPSLSAQDIKKLLAKDLPISSTPQSGAIGEPSEFAWYYSLVRDRMYMAWAQPGDLPGAAGLRTEVLIRVERDGAVTRQELVRSSGNAIMDDSVMKAVKSVSRLQALPPGIQGLYKDITIEFELTKATL